MSYLQNMLSWDVKTRTQRIDRIARPRGPQIDCGRDSVQPESRGRSGNQPARSASHPLAAIARAVATARSGTLGVYHDGRDDGRAGPPRKVRLREARTQSWRPAQLHRAPDSRKPAQVRRRV